MVASTCLLQYLLVSLSLFLAEKGVRVPTLTKSSSSVIKLSAPKICPGSISRSVPAIPRDQSISIVSQSCPHSYSTEGVGVND